MRVVDASIIAPALAHGGDDGDACRRKISAALLAAPDLLRLETISVYRRHSANGSLTDREARDALDDHMDLRLTLYPTGPLLRRIWEFRSNLCAYDAFYAALAEALDCLLTTAGARPRCRFDLA